MRQAPLLRSPLLFLKDTATTEIYPLSLRDALPIFAPDRGLYPHTPPAQVQEFIGQLERAYPIHNRYEREVSSEEHTSELQPRQYLVCRLLLEKKGFALSPFSLCLDSLVRAAPSLAL